MRTIQLYVNGASTGTTQGLVTLFGNEPISIDFSIQDIKDVNKSKGSVTQTFTVPADKNNNILFNHCFEIGVDSSFNPSKKTPAFLLVDNNVILNGSLQLSNIKVKNKIPISYEIILYGDVLNLASSMGDKLLTDLDFSELNHTYDADSIENSWSATTSKNGFYYPLVDYGYDLSLDELNTGILQVVVDSGLVSNATINTLQDITQTWNINQYAVGTAYTVTIVSGKGYGQSRFVLLNNTTTLTTFTNWDIIPDSTSRYHITIVDTSNPFNSTGNGLSPLIFKPALSNTYLIKKILNTAGFDLADGIVDEDVIAQTIIPFNGDFNDTISTEYIDARTFNVGLSGDSICYNFTINTGTFITAFTDESSAGRFDNGGLYDNISSPPTYSADTVTAQDFGVTIRYQYNNALNPTRFALVKFFRSSYSLVVPFDEQFADAIGDGNIRNLTVYSKPLDDLKSLTNYPLVKGEKIWIEVFFDGQLISGTPSYATLLASGSYWFNRISTKLVVGGDVLYNKFIPKNIKQIDYFNSIVKMFNLMIVPDKNQTNKIALISKDEYFSIGEEKDWTNKVDHSRNIEEIFINDTQAKIISFNFKEDKDYYSANFKEKTNTIYGQYIKTNNADSDGEKKIDVIFSSTPNDKVLGTTDIYCPKIAKRDEKTGVYGRTDFNIRFLRKNQDLMPTVNTFQLEGKTPMNFYPFCGDVDHPTESTIAYTFGTPSFLFYETSSLTPNNLINNFWKNTLDDISNKNSRIIKAYIYLTPADIAKFNYNDKIYIDGLTSDGGQYYVINKLTYTPTSNQPSLVELIMINRNPSVFEAASQPVKQMINPIIGQIGLGDNQSKSKNTIIAGNISSIGINSQGSLAIGTNNFIGNNSKNTHINGENNFVGNDVTGTIIFGSNNKIGTISASTGTTSISGVTLLGVSNYTATTSDTVYVPNIQFTSTGGTINGVSFNTIVNGGQIWTSGSTGAFNIKAKNDSAIDVSGNYAVAEGYQTTAIGNFSHSEGATTIAIGDGSHAEGDQTTSFGSASHSEGAFTTAIGLASHSEGAFTFANGLASHAEGLQTTASGDTSHAEGNQTLALGFASHAEGINTQALGDASHAEGQLTTAIGINSHAEGGSTQALGEASHAEGGATTALGFFSHTEGNQTFASGTSAHAEGYLTRAEAENTHSGGFGAKADHYGEWARSSNGSNVAGFGQYGIIDIMTNTSNATLTEMFIGAVGGTRITIGSGKAYRYTLTMIAQNSSTGAVKEWEAKGLIKNVAGTTSMVGSSNVSTYADASMATASLSIAADNTNDSLLVQATGIAATNISWYGRMDYTRIN